MADKPDIIVKADLMLRQAETVSDHESRAKQVKEAFDVLNVYLNENPTSEHREYIDNRKRAYTRSHLQRLSMETEPDRETWFFNFLLFATAGQEVTQVLEQHPDLRPWYDAFLRSQREWATKELAPLLGRTGDNG